MFKKLAQMTLTRSACVTEKLDFVTDNLHSSDDASYWAGSGARCQPRTTPGASTSSA